MGKSEADFRDQAGSALARSGMLLFDLGSRSRLRRETCYALSERAPRVPHHGTFRFGFATTSRLQSVRGSSV